MAADDLKKKIELLAKEPATGYYLTDTQGRRYPSDPEGFSLKPFCYPIDVPEGRFRITFLAGKDRLPPHPDHPLAAIVLRFDTGEEGPATAEGSSMLAQVQEAAESARIRQDTLKAEQKANVQITRDQELAGFLGLISDMRGLVRESSVELVKGRLDLARELAGHNQLLMKQQTEVLQFVQQNLESLRQGPPPPVDYRPVYEKGFEMVRDVTVALINRPSRPASEKSAEGKAGEPGDVVSAKGDTAPTPAGPTPVTPEQAIEALDTLVGMDAVDLAQIFSSPDALADFFRKVGNTAKVMAQEEAAAR